MGFASRSHVRGGKGGQFTRCYLIRFFLRRIGVRDSVGFFRGLCKLFVRFRYVLLITLQAYPASGDRKCETLRFLIHLTISGRSLRLVVQKKFTILWLKHNNIAKLISTFLYSRTSGYM